MKKYLAATAALLAIVTVFSACGEVETATDSKGNTYAYMTDENNEILQDKDGNMVVAVTDENGEIVENENGEIVTESVSFPEILELDGYVQNKYFKTKIPDGWTQVGRGAMNIKNEDTNTQYTLDVREGKTPDDLEEEIMKEYSTQSESESIDKFDLEKQEVTLGGKKMLKITFDYTLKEKNVFGSMGLSYSTYIVGDNGRTFLYTCTERQEHKGEVDFDTIISEIIYK